MKYLRKVGNAGGENADVVDALTNLSDDAPVAEPMVGWSEIGRNPI